MDLFNTYESGNPKYVMSNSSVTHNPWNALRNGSRKSAFLPYKVSQYKKVI